MSLWKVKNFLGELYCEEGEEQSDVEEWCGEEVTLDDSDDEIKHERSTTPLLETLAYSSRTALECRDTPAGSVRERSRSSIVKVETASNPQPSLSSGFAVLEWIFRDDELTQHPLDEEDLPEGDVVEDQTLAPDAHAVYASENESSGIREMNTEAKRSEGDVRTEGQSGSRGRKLQVRGLDCVLPGACGVGRRRQGSVQRYQWDFDHPLEEIFMRDSDVPAELRYWDDVRKREVRAQEKRRTVKGEKSGSDDEDCFKDATDERRYSLLQGESPILKWYPMETFQPKEELFTPERTGSVQRHWSPYDAFRSFWDESILEHIVASTNRYASNITSSSFKNEWYPTSTHEVLCLFAFWMMLGIVRMPTVKSCFSTDPLLRTEVFRKIFTAHRYTALTRALNFANTADSTNSDPSVRSDLLYPIRPIITSLNVKFQANYVPSKDICIDESLTHWKGKLNIIRQYIPSKAAKYGIKTIELCESATGYLWSFKVYTGKQKGAAIVKKLIDPLLNKGYRLFMGNWNKSLALARFLKRNGTDCVGTLRPYDQDVPNFIHQAPLKKGQLIARHFGNVCVLSWQDNKRVTMISTCHGTAAGLPRVPSKPGTRHLIFKPQVVLDYDRSMGGVDLKDEMLEPYLLERKMCSKWYMKLVKRFLNVSISNARILMESSLQCPQEENLNFRLRLVDTILDNHLSQCPQPRRHVAKIARLPDPVRKVPHIHWPVRVEATEGYSSRNRKTRVRCSVCVREGRKTVKTPFKCEACNVPLCVVGCFKKYHVA